MDTYFQKYHQIFENLQYLTFACLYDGYQNIDFIYYKTKENISNELKYNQYLALSISFGYLDKMIFIASIFCFYVFNYDKGIYFHELYFILKEDRIKVLFDLVEKNYISKEEVKFDEFLVYQGGYDFQDVLPILETLPSIQKINICPNCYHYVEKYEADDCLPLRNKMNEIEKSHQSTIISLSIQAHNNYLVYDRNGNVWIRFDPHGISNRECTWKFDKIFKFLYQERYIPDYEYYLIGIGPQYVANNIPYCAILSIMMIEIYIDQVILQRLSIEKIFESLTSQKFIYDKLKLYLQCIKINIKQL